MTIGAGAAEVGAGAAVVGAGAAVVGTGAAVVGAGTAVVGTGAAVVVGFEYPYISKIHPPAPDFPSGIVPSLTK